MQNYTKNDISILRQIYRRKATTELISVSIKTIHEETGLSIIKIRQTLSKFIEDGFIKKGFKREHAYTFFITKKGIEKLNEILGGVTL